VRRARASEGVRRLAGRVGVFSARPAEPVVVPPEHIDTERPRVVAAVSLGSDREEIRRAPSGTHKGLWCQEGMGHWPGGFAWCRPGWA
jgi:hypothetical protein